MDGPLGRRAGRLQRRRLLDRRHRRAARRFRRRRPWTPASTPPCATSIWTRNKAEVAPASGTTAATRTAWPTRGRRSTTRRPTSASRSTTTATVRSTRSTGEPQVRRNGITGCTGGSGFIGNPACGTSALYGPAYRTAPSPVRPAARCRSSRVATEPLLGSSSCRAAGRRAGRLRWRERGINLGGPEVRMLAGSTLPLTPGDFGLDP